MSASKYILGTAAIVGGVYYYDKNVQPILPRQQRQQIRHEVDRAEQKSSDLTNKLSNKIEESKKELSQKSQEFTDKIKDTTLYQKVTEHQDEAKANYRALKAPEDKNLIARGVDKYIDLVNGASGVDTKTTPYSSVSPDYEVKEKSWFGDWFKKDDDKFNQKLGEAKKEASDKKDEWISWGSKKSDEAEKQGESWSKWGSKKTDELSNDINKTYEDGKKELNKQGSKLQSNLSETKDQLSASYQEGKAAAIRNFEEAKAKVDELTTRLQKSTEPNKEEKLHQARLDLNSSLANLKSYGDDVVNEITSKFK
ncbi:putative hyphal cell wall protein [Suhomyces tanzawaensis NRRL Y-17324]|uniref:Putative hyphal cell wall protein n=1 Tax=Suhomyces tanzawaensis NRRL Y-17324 TaxID=984487 RepID=A0A1E4SK42_9ASCO|nr:putative hyphal cell wall protein [Suhomyces tanzawaensis NRRL Y-17324]ODV79873.1 putative hyphal cell wall protein [Suhomyces tanzawaensis NRRL Y-17324]